MSLPPKAQAQANRRGHFSRIRLPVGRTQLRAGRGVPSECLRVELPAGNPPTPRYATLRCSHAGAVSSLPRTNSSMSWKRSKGGKTKLNDRRHAVPYMCAIHMQCTCYAHAVLCLYQMHMQCTCYARAMRMLCAWHANAMHMQRTGYASPMRFNAHVEHMLCACCSYVTHVQ